MINKKSLWFLTLFSLILVLSIYYITMPSELMLNNTNNTIKEKNKTTKTKDENKDEKANVNIEESDLLVALRVESDSEMQDKIDNLKNVLTNESASTDEKNQAYEKIKTINDNRSEEENLEKSIKDEFNLNSFIKIEDDQIKVTIDSKEHDTSIANKIIKKIQSNYETNKYISVKFQK